jgi:hypothetical protein
VLSVTAAWSSLDCTLIHLHMVIMIMLLVFSLSSLHLGIPSDLFLHQNFPIMVHSWFTVTIRRKQKF